MNSRKPPSPLHALLGLTLAVSGATASAAPSRALDRASVWLGAYLTERQAEVRATHASAGSGELKSGNDHETVGRARLDFLVGDHHGFTLDYYTLDHRTSITIDRPFEFEGIAFDVDATLRSKLDFSAASASYHWWFGDGDDVFGVGLGATWYRLDYQLSGNATAAGHSTSGSVRFEEQAAAPLLQLAWKHAFSDDLRVYLHASGVRKAGGNLSGHVHDGRVGIEWFPTRHVGLGAEYGITRIRLQRDADRYTANLDIDLDGPSLFARFRF